MLCGKCVLLTYGDCITTPIIGMYIKNDIGLAKHIYHKGGVPTVIIS